MSNGGGGRPPSKPNASQDPPFLRFAWGAVLPWGFLGLLAAVAHAQGTVTIDAAGTATPVQRGFAGFSVEMSSVGSWSGTYDLTTPASFDSALVNLVNLLGS